MSHPTARGVVGWFFEILSIAGVIVWVVAAREKRAQAARDRSRSSLRLELCTRLATDGPPCTGTGDCGGTGFESPWLHAVFHR